MEGTEADLLPPPITPTETKSGTGADSVLPTITAGMGTGTEVTY